MICILPILIYETVQKPQKSILCFILLVEIIKE